MRFYINITILLVFIVQQPSYYRDLIRNILQEEDDDVPAPPTRKQLLKNKFHRSMREKKRYSDLWIGSPHYSQHAIEIMFHLGYNPVEAHSVIENPTIIKFDNTITVGLTYDDYDSLYPSKNGRSRAAQRIAENIKAACLEDYGIDDQFEPIKWESKDWIVFTCPKFTDFLTDQFQPLIYLLGGDFNPGQIYDTVSEYFNKE
jgi:hypothetical protein